MKKLLRITFPTFILLLFSACAPKANSGTAPDPSPLQTPYAVYETFTLYFPDLTANKIIKETHELRIYDDITPEKLILDTLKMGAKDNNASSPIAPNAIIQSIKTVSGLCTVDYTEPFLNINDTANDNANLMLQAIVQSLCELDTIQQVKFNINGNTNAKLYDQIDLSQPISPNIDEL